MTEICGCGQLWTTPVDIDSPKSGDATSLEKDKSFSTREGLVDALIDAMDILSARVEGLEFQFAAFLSVLDRPLSPAESIEELRRLRDGLP